MKGIYLDHSMAARPLQIAVSAMLPFYSDYWGSPAAPHQGGYELMQPLENSYRLIYQLLGASTDDLFVYTASGTEAINHVFHSVYWGKSRTGLAKEYVVAADATAPTLMAVARLEEMGCRGVIVEADNNGVITTEALERVLTPQTALVSLSWGHGLTGVIQPVAEISALCRRRGITLHLDVTHILGKIPCHAAELGADYLTFNGEQLHAPQGCGGVLFKADAQRYPLLVGGVDQACMRAGSLNVPAIVALGVACREALAGCDHMGTEIARLRYILEEGIISGCEGAQILCIDAERLPHVTTICFPGIVNEALLFALNRSKIFACIGGGMFQQLALNLIGYGIQPALAYSSISFSLGRDTDDEDIKRAIEGVTAAFRQLMATAF
jgi:cysteine desulfurase